MQCSAREQVQDDDFVKERSIGSGSGEQGVKNQWNAFTKTAKSVAARQTMPRVAWYLVGTLLHSGRGGQKRSDL